MTVTSVTSLQGHQLDDAGAMLTRAFFDDPMMVYLFPDEARRAKALPWFMRTAMKYGQRHGEVHTTPQQPEGAAVWLPPAHPSASTLGMLRAGMWQAPLQFGLRALPRAQNAIYLEHVHRRDMPPEHWYLMVLGVDPPRQGQGVGGALIAPILARADEAGLPCYLETMKERNLPFYRRHGFDVLLEDDLPKGGPHFWTMKRAPRG